MVWLTGEITPLVSLCLTHSDDATTRQLSNSLSAGRAERPSAVKGSHVFN